MRRIVVSAVVLLASAQLFAQGSIGGFGMGVALKKMSDNLHFENPFRKPEDER
jgi:hypothetical protein